MKWLFELFVNFVIRMIVGVSLIFLLNQFFIAEEIDLSVGINPVTVVTSGVLGVPGVGLLYGILLFD